MTAAIPVSEVFGPVTQGEGPHTGRLCWFLRLGLCNLHCEWCTAPGTRITRPDFTTVAVEDLKVGDEVLSRTPPGGGKHGKLTRGVVTAISRRDAERVRVNGGLVCAVDKKFWIAQNRNARSGWREITRSIGMNAAFLTDPVTNDRADYERGHLAGMADGDWSFWDHHARRIETVEPVDPGEVVSITTSTGNYFADGWLVHNCDTPYTWDQKRYDVNTECPPRTADWIVRRLNGAGLVILSGGEPLIHQHNDALTDAIRRLHTAGTRWHVETNGTRVPSSDSAALIDHFVVSPKVNPQGDPEKRRLNPVALTAFADLAGQGRASFKVVCRTPAEVEAAAEFFDRYAVPHAARWIMPEGVTPDRILATARTLHPTAVELGMNFTLRQHALLYGTERRR